MRFQLAPSAANDLRFIYDSVEKSKGIDAADDCEERLFEGFLAVADFPGLGHSRSDLTSIDVHFYFVEPYFLVYRRGVDPLPILAIVHGSRDLKRLLRKRL